MDYDPVKDRLGDLASGGPIRYRAFLGALHAVFLRSWYVRGALREVLGRYVGRKTVDVLDAGTGFGQFAEHLLRTDPRVRLHAVDIKEDYLVRLRRHLERTGLARRATVAIDDLTDLQAGGPYDLVLSVDVMEHIEDDVTVFRHFARVLRPGGHLVVNTPSDRGGSDVGSGGGSFIGEHVRDGYGPDEIREKLERAGLRTESITWTYGPIGTLAWRLLVRWPMTLLGRSMTWLPLVALYYVPVFPLGMLLNAVDASVRNEEGTGILVVARKD
jgi:SAM-dependent methyltransferase